MRVITAPYEPEIDIDTVLGECPVWDPETGVLHFVDIGANTVFHYHYASKQLTKDYYDDCIGSIVKRKGKSGFVAIAEKGFGYIEEAAPGSSMEKPGKIQYFVNPAPDMLPSTRMMNDAACDSRGRLIAGVKTRRGDPFNEDQKPGTFWRLEKVADQWKTEQIDQDMTVPNGVALNKAGDVLYMNDTRAPHVLAYDYDAQSGRLSNKRVFVTTPYKGRPDGLCLDDEDCLWVAKYEGAAVTRYRPDGSVDMEVRFDSSLFITAPVFGGPDMDILFVTTGSLQEAGYSDDQKSEWPSCGAVFAVHVPGVKGLEKRKFAW